MEDSFPHRAYFRQISGRNPCIWTCPTTTDVSFLSKTQVLGKGPKCVLSCTIPTLNRHLSNGMADDRLLFPIWAPRFYLERSMRWREHKPLLFVSFKPGHKRDIVPSTISGWIRKRFWSTTQIPLHLSLSPTRLRHTRYDPWLHCSHSTDRPPWNRFWKLITGAVNTFTDFYLKDLSLCSADLIQLGPVVAAESILHPTLEIIRGNIVYIPPSIHLDSAPCEATEPG